MKYTSHISASPAGRARMPSGPGPSGWLSQYLAPGVDMEGAFPDISG